MIVYFADREMQILGSAATKLKKGYVIADDLRTEEVETGVASFYCYIGFTKETRARLEAMTNAGNYILRSGADGKNEFYTIIDSEINTKTQEIYVYAEDAGLDLINEIVGEFEADNSYNAKWYIDKFILDSGFEIGINEIPTGTKHKLKWEGESTVTARLASIATEFGDYEVSYSFAIKGMTITHKYINFHKKRGQDNGVQLRLNKEIDKIITTKSVANLATALVCEGGVPDDADVPITLNGYKYDDGDFYVDGDKLKSRKALAKWSRYVWNKEPKRLKGFEGHIVRPFSYNTTSQSELCTRAVTELKKLCDMEVNFEVGIHTLPKGVKIGDRVTIIDDAGETYVSTRVLVLETSETNNKHTATLGEHIIKKGGISQKVKDLAADFAKTAQSAARALSISNAAKTTADAAHTQATEAAEEAAGALAKAEEAQTAANTATESAATAQEKAQQAEEAVGKVEESVAGLEVTITTAQTAAANAHQAATEATAKAEEAKTAATNAAEDAEEAKSAAEAAQTTATGAVAKADDAISTAGTAKDQAQTASDTAAAAKADAKQAADDVAALGDTLETYRQTFEADYARKTDLTETESHLQSQITANAGQISSTIQQVTKIDETANNAKELAEAAQETASAAQTKADEATADALAAQTAADEAAAAATAAQGEADKAKAAAATAQGVADKAESDLAAAKADLATVTGRVDATEEEIAAAQAAVDTAQAAADEAKTNAATAAQKATAAQNTADTAVTNAQSAQTAANDAASAAALAQQTADQAKGDASAAQSKANEAAATAAAAQNTANTAVSNAATAQAKANQAAQEATAAQQAADDADAKAAAAQSDLNTAKQNLADVTSRVGATEAEVEAAQAAVELAQQAADDAQAEAEAAQSTANTAKANAATAQQAATTAKQAADAAQQAADDAQAAADKAQADVNALAVTVTEQWTAINQKADSITVEAYKSEITQTIEDMEIGGRNLLQKTNTANGWSGNSACVFDATEKALALTTAYYAGMVNPYRSAQTAPYISLEANTTYTVSYKLKYSGDLDKVWVWIATGGGLNSSYLKRIAASEIGTDKYTSFTYTFNTRNSLNSANINIQFHSYIPDNTDTTAVLYIKDVKLEKGVKATDWTPAPEDVPEGVANELSNYYTKTESDAKFKVSSNEILSTVSSTYTTKEDFENRKGGENRNYVIGTSDEWQSFTTNGSQKILTISTPTLADAETHNYYEIGIAANEYMTVSVDLEPDTVPMCVCIYNNGGYSEYGNYIANGETGRSTATLKRYAHQSTFKISIYAETGSYQSGKYKCLKIEKGDRATEWTTAPEDTLQASEDAADAQYTAEEAQKHSEGVAERVTSAESIIQQLSDAINLLVTDDSGTTLLQQTSTGWSFNLGNVQTNLEGAVEQLGELNEKQGSTEGTVKNLQQAVDDLGVLSEYITIGTYTYTDADGKEHIEPSIDLGKKGTGFNLKITNTRIWFTDGSTDLVEINSKTKSLEIGTATIKGELQMGDEEAPDTTGVWIWKQRSNGNLGLVWKGVSE